ncbi:MAG: SEC-C metal-binding domain-containing protein, partial [Gammaproteobacteria bacterium]|nr:SEC-C metal-binding domain-containing protein [Gammaproteobacteria bacterium]
FDIRKNLLEYDDVANDQRQVIYQQRNDLMGSADLSDTIETIREEVVADLFFDYVPPQSIEDQWDVQGLEQALAAEFNSQQPVSRWLDEDESLSEDPLRERILAQINQEYAQKESAWAAQGIDMRVVEKQIMLTILDQKWKEHLATMDHLRQGIHLRAYAQKQPKQEYKREAFVLFQELLQQIKRDVIRLLCRVQVEREGQIDEVERRRREEQERRMRYQHAAAATSGAEAPSPADPRPATFVRGERKIGRNEPCPCGSGKKYKHCCGKAA